MIGPGRKYPQAVMDYLVTPCGRRRKTAMVPVAVFSAAAFLSAPTRDGVKGDKEERAVREGKTEG